MGRYVRALVPRLCAAREDVSLALFVAPGTVETALRGVELDAAAAQRVAVHPVSAMRRFAADVHWYPWNVATPLPAHGPVVVTIHDVAPIALPDRRIGAIYRRALWRYRYAHATRRATLVLTVSEFTRSEVVRLLRVPDSRIRVTPLGADEPPQAGAGSAPGGDVATLDRLGVRPPYALVVGAGDRRKNLPLARSAVRQLVARGVGVTLVEAGPRRDATAPEPWRRPLGFVDRADLPALYRGAAAVIVPSTYEGFGLPLLEAMAHGAPVIASRAASLPEVGGNVPAWFEPGDEAAAAAHLDRLLRDPVERARMATAGRVRASAFSWSRTAAATLAAFDEAVAAHRRG